MDKPGVKKLLKEIVVAYPSFEVPEPRFNLWCDMMADISFKHAHDNLIEHIKTNRFPPTIADIRGIARKNSTTVDNYCEVTGNSYEVYEPERRREMN